MERRSPSSELLHAATRAANSQELELTASFALTKFRANTDQLAMALEIALARDSSKTASVAN